MRTISPPEGIDPSFLAPSAMTSSRFIPFTTMVSFSASASMPTELRKGYLEDKMVWINEDDIHLVIFSMLLPAW